ncbi:hypothetical protein INT47_010344 [Mucor saturninus]|uniref:Uncharacterized protein n=1 Tax=Mucor saturninus TaxID=64648 RepID=A0A8H7UUZ5_9FUNG|nr:hypothetical protein INT47_010344 [Mucor saturninus]
MPAYNINDMVRTIIKLQKQVFDLQTEIRSNHSQTSAVKRIARFPEGKKSDTGIVTEKGKPEVQLNPILSTKTWGMHSRELKMKYILALEALARRGKIGLDQCLDHWGAERLLASVAHNTLGEKLLSKKKASSLSDDEEIIPPGLGLEQQESFSILNAEQSGGENDVVPLHKDLPVTRPSRKRRIVNK